MAAKIVIVGGVAGGASTAARLRRLSEEARIVLFERGEHISYANCGLPYYLGAVIKEREDLFVVTPDRFREWYNIDVRVNSEVTAIDRRGRRVTVLERGAGREYSESYDCLVLAPGAEPIRPSLPGIDSPGIFTLRSVADTDRIDRYIGKHNPRTALVAGGGFVGLEMAENLHARGLAVSLVEAAPQVLPHLDREMAVLVQQHLREKGIALYLDERVASFTPDGVNGIIASLAGGGEIRAGLAILAVGVRPEVKLAREAGLEVGRGIRVNEFLQTSDPRIYALGDAVEVTDLVTGSPAVVPLAGPANRQGRIVAGNIAGRRETYRGAQGTAILKLFDLAVASTGAGSRSLEQAGLSYHSCIIHPYSHAGYYPGAEPLTLKLLFGPAGQIYGAQAVGSRGADKRIDVIAAALRAGQSVFDLQALELAYAPPFSSAKDPVNMAGYVAGNILRGDVAVIDSAALAAEPPGTVQIVDVRDPDEYAEGHIPGAVNIPLGQLRARLGELSPARDLVVYCAAGMRSYLAARIMMQKGFHRVRNLNGGYRIYHALEVEAAAGGGQDAAPAGKSGLSA